MRVVIAVLLILGLTLLLLFVLTNSGADQSVPVNLLLWDRQEYPVSLVALVSLVAGVLFASVIGIVEGARLRLQNHQLRGKLKRQEAELQSLRNVALKPPEDAGRVDEESSLYLVFLETQLTALAAKTPHAKMIDVLCKSLAKMSTAGHAAALELTLGEANRALLAEAISEFETRSSD